MTTVKERMMQAVAATGTVGAYESIVDACVAVATSDNGKLLDMLKEKNEQIASLSVSLADTHKYVDKLELEKAAVGQFNGNAPAETMTKRERLAESMMQGLLSNPSIGHYSDDKADAYARSALTCANALLRVLAVDAPQ